MTDAELLHEAIQRVSAVMPEATAVELHVAGYTQGRGFQLAAVHIGTYELPISWAEDYLRDDIKRMSLGLYDLLSDLAWCGEVGEGELGEAVIEIESGQVIRSR